MPGKERFLNMIANNQVEQVIEELLKLDFEENYKKQILVISSRYKKLKQDNIIGVINHEQQQTTQNQITASLLEFIENCFEDQDNSSKVLYESLEGTEEKKIITKSRTSKILGVIGSIASIIGLILYFIPTQTNDVVDLKKVEDHKRYIKEKLSGIQDLSLVEAKHKLNDLENYISQIMDEKIKLICFKELSHQIFNDQGAKNNSLKRAIRGETFALMKRLNGANFTKIFSNDELENLDLYAMDFKRCNLEGVSFKGAFLVDSDFENAILTNCNFNHTSIRNVNFKSAKLTNATFKESDWFNSENLDANQILDCDTSTLFSPPKSIDEIYSYLDEKYAYPFSTWDISIKRELNKIWKDYYSENGLISSIYGITLNFEESDSL